MAVPTLASTAMECPEAAPLSAILGRIRKWSYVVIGCTGRGQHTPPPPLDKTALCTRIVILVQSAGAPSLILPLSHLGSA